VLAPEAGTWTRRITNLDDGLRYQCAAPWRSDTSYPEWSCSNYAPIPGRETRDMGRSDYNTLQRTTRIISYGRNWLERQNNVKTIDRDGVRTPLAREEGRNWYVRLPDTECAPAREFAAPRMAFWELLQETWEEVLDGSSAFVERTPAGAPPRFVRMIGLEARYRDLSKRAVRQEARRAILQLIDEYRAE
jgi:hypothetical protein